MQMSYPDMRKPRHFQPLNGLKLPGFSTEGTCG